MHLLKPKNKNALMIINKPGFTLRLHSNRKYTRIALINGFTF